MGKSDAETLSSKNPAVVLGRVPVYEALDQLVKLLLFTPPTIGV